MFNMNTPCLRKCIELEPFVIFSMSFENIVIHSTDTEKSKLMVIHIDPFSPLNVNWHQSNALVRLQRRPSQSNWHSVLYSTSYKVSRKMKSNSNWPPLSNRMRNRTNRHFKHTESWSNWASNRKSRIFVIVIYFSLIGPRMIAWKLTEFWPIQMSQMNRKSI